MNMLVPAFVFVSVLAIIASALSLFERKFVYAIVAFAFAGALCSALFFLLGQGFAAVLELLMATGITACLIAVMSSEERRIKDKSAWTASPYGSTMALFLLSLYAALSLLFIYAAPGSAAAGAATVNSFVVYLEMAFESYYVLLYALVLMLFAGVVGSVIAVKRVSRVIA
jgi:NADH:ubiquinone oxidoreductase subunit 6 (subunit J)